MAKTTVISHYCSEWHLRYRTVGLFSMYTVPIPLYLCWKVPFSRLTWHVPFPPVHHCKSYIPFRNSSNPVSARKSSMPTVAHKDLSFAEAHKITCCLVWDSPLLNFNIFAEWIKYNLWKSRFFHLLFPTPKTAKSTLGKWKEFDKILLDLPHKCMHWLHIGWNKKIM